MAQLSKRIESLSPIKRQLLQAKLGDRRDSSMPIAIVGMACRFPGAADLDAYWELISQGENRFAEVSAARWPVDRLFDPDADVPGRSSSKWACLIDDLDQFDPQFFGITPREASRMDPQQRMLLRCAWQAMEHAAIDPRSLSRSPTGVFVGVGQTDYSRAMGVYDNAMYHLDAHCGTGGSLSISANRISYAFDFTGPSVAVDTACSSALVAVHQAMVALRRGECDAALVGGVNVCITPDSFISLSKARMLSPTGQCRPFDDSANGYVRGEGCGVALLKPLSAAQRDGDNVLAVLKGAATNHGGRTSGITAPNADAQQRVIRRAINDAGLDPGMIGYVEAHGTGTPLGDPMEIESLSKVFRRESDEDRPLYVTSVKANIGHTEIAAGIAGLIKTVLVMRHGVVPPQAGLEAFNRNLQFGNSRLAIPTQTQPWKTDSASRYAGVSSFGFGGTNSHVVLECPAVDTATQSGSVDVNETPSVNHGKTESEVRTPADSQTTDGRSSSDRPQLLVFSAPTVSALKRIAGQLRERVAGVEQTELGEVAFTAATGRAHFEQRVGIVAADADEAVGALDRIAEGRSSPLAVRVRIRSGSRQSIAALMTGQGSQSVGMGMGLYQSHPAFRRAFDECESVVAEVRGESLREVIAGRMRDGQPWLNQTAWTQPALFAIEYASTRMWQDFGLSIDMLIGHSVGEYVAAAVADVMDLETAVRMICRRGELMQSLPAGGTMAVLMASADEVKQMLTHHQAVDIAAFNGPENTTVAGPIEAVETLLDDAESGGVAVQRLTVSHAFHSRAMDPILESFREFASQFDYSPPTIPIISNLTGDVEYDAVFDANYWTDHIRRPVRFLDGAKQLSSERVDVTIEMGPSSVLTSLARRAVNDAAFDSVTTLKRDQDEAKHVTMSLAKLYTMGVGLDWTAVLRGPHRRTSLPGYPFADDSYWFRPDHATRYFADFITGQSHLTPMIGSRCHHPRDTMFESHLTNFQPRHLADHRVMNDTVVPAAGFADMTIAAAAAAFETDEVSLENLTLQKAMFLSDRPLRVQTIIEGQSAVRRKVSVFARHCDADCEEPWQLHATASVVHQGELQSPRVDLQNARENPVVHLQRDEFYDVVLQRGLDYRKCYRMIDQMFRGDDEVVCDVTFDVEVIEKISQYRFHPALGDAAMQAMVGAIPLESDGALCSDLYLPVSIGQMKVECPSQVPTSYFVRRTSTDTSPSPAFVQGDVVACNDDGDTIAWWRDVRVQRVQTRRQDADDRPNQWLYQTEWVRDPDTRITHEDTRSRKAVLIIGDADEFTNALTESLNQLVKADPSQEIEIHRVSLDRDKGHVENEEGLPLTTTADAFGSYLREWLADRSDPQAIDMVFAGARSARFDPDAAIDSTRRSEDVWTDLFVCLREMSPVDLPGKVGVWFPTRDACLVRGDELIDPCQTAVVALSQVASQEVRGKNVRVVDLDGNQSLSLQAEQFTACMGYAGVERTVAIRDGERFVPRLRHKPDLLSESKLLEEFPRGERFRTRLSGDDTIDSLRFETLSRPTLETHQVEIHVHATGVNFSDILKAIGLYPGIVDDVVPLGLECSGVVTGIGSEVTGLEVGDHVMGIVPYGFASHCVTDAIGLVKMPKNLDHLEAASIPIAFLTAQHCLANVARVQPGEKVLIHAGAGGVGLAAIQIARHLKAEVFATAGSPVKRKFLMDLGVDHVMDSRSLDFAEQISEITQGRGVDVVLNSLPGEAIEKSLQALAAYGRFVEIGKTDIYANRPIGLAPFQDNLTYAAVDLDRLFRQRPGDARKMLIDIVTRFADQTYRPIPFTTFAAEDLVPSFRYMSQRKNIGKIVVDMVGSEILSSSAIGDSQRENLPQESLDSAVDGDASVIRSDSTYLVTGGLGSLGLATARWLAREGAGGVVLLSRRPPEEAAQMVVDGINQTDTRCHATAADVCDATSLSAALDGLPSDLPPIRGLFHAAGTMENQSIPKMTEAEFRSVIPAKTIGTLTVLDVLDASSLDFVVLYSSLSSTLATNGQANYGVANAFLDGLASRFENEKPKFLAINWGAFDGGGMAAGLDEIMASQGVRLLPVDQSLELIAPMLESGSSTIPVFRGEWERFNVLLRSLMTGDLEYTLTDLLSERADETDDGEMAEFRESLLRLPTEEVKPKLQVYFTRALSEIMGIDEDDIDPQTTLTSLGMDSLMALELGNKMESALQIELPMSIYLQGPTIEKLVDYGAGVIETGTSELTDAQA